jgi:hypothetical protein
MRDILLGRADGRTPRLVTAGQARLSFAALAAVLCAFLARDVRAQEILRWKLKTGDVLKYSLEQKQVMIVKQSGRERKQTSDHTVDYRWSVSEVSANGDADVTLQIDHVIMKVSMPPFLPFEYDSRSPKAEVPEVFESNLQMIKASIGSEISFKMKSTGEIAEVKIPEPTLKKLRDALPKDAGPDAALSEQALKDILIQSSPPPFPQQPLEVGKNWAGKPSRLSSPGLGTLVTDRVFTFQGPDPKNPRLMLIGSESRVSLEPAENVAAKIRSQESKGSLTFDAEAGHLVGNRLTQKMELTMSVMGQEVQQTSDTTSVMTLVP